MHDLPTVNTFEDDRSRDQISTKIQSDASDSVSNVEAVIKPEEKSIVSVTPVDAVAIAEDT